MTFTFKAAYQAIEFAADCRNAGIVVIIDPKTYSVTLTESKIQLACELLIAACNQ